jgi:hypothetical protein
MRDYVCTLEESRTKNHRKQYGPHELQFVLHPFTHPFYSSKEETEETENTAKNNTTSAVVDGKGGEEKVKIKLCRNASFFLAFKGVRASDSLPENLLKKNSQYWIDSIRSQYQFSNMSSSKTPPEEAPSTTCKIIKWVDLPDFVFSKEPHRDSTKAAPASCEYASNMYSRQQATEFRRSQQMRMEVMQRQHMQQHHMQQQHMQQQHMQQQHMQQQHQQRHQQHMMHFQPQHIRYRNNIQQRQKNRSVVYNGNFTPATTDSSSLKNRTRHHYRDSTKERVRANNKDGNNRIKKSGGRKATNTYRQNNYTTNKGNKSGKGGKGGSSKGNKSGKGSKGNKNSKSGFSSDKNGEHRSKNKSRSLKVNFSNSSDIDFPKMSSVN